MTDYLDQSHSSYEQTYRGADYYMDDPNMLRSVPRGSPRSQASGANASTKAWVLEQARTIPDESLSSVPSRGSNVRRSRPLPTEPPFRQSRVPVKYELAQAPEPAEYHPPQAYTLGVDKREFPFGYPHQGAYNVPPAEQSRFSPESELPRPLQPLQTPSGQPSRSFVGGFFKGLKRWPKMLKGGSKAERQVQRKGTFGTEGTSTTAIGMERGNTLPRYLSNPSIGPSNPQFAHRLSMAKIPPNSVPHDPYHRDSPSHIPVHEPSYPYTNNLHLTDVPPQMTNGHAYGHDNSIHLRENPAGPQHPIVTLTPPSDGLVDEEQADFYDGPTNEYPQQQFEEGMENESSPRGRATVMIYSTDSQAPAVTSPVPMPTPQRGATPGRVSYQPNLPTRASVQGHRGPVAGPSNTGPALSPVPPLGSMQPMLQSPNSYLSGPTTTSRCTTMSTFASHYDPSFASSLGPVEKFFKGLYNLPWVAERVTVDYRPADSDRARKKVKKNLKKPLTSWYRSVLTRSRRLSQTVDILSSGSGSISGLDLTSNFEPPRPRRAEHSAHRRHNSAKAKDKAGGHRSRRHTSQTTSTDAHHPRPPSPIVPTPYPYPYAPVYPYPYTYPYAPPPAAPAPPHHGERSKHRHKSSKRRAAAGAAAYAAYQPMAIPPPQTMPAAAPQMYFISPSPPQSNNGGAAGGAAADAVPTVAQSYQTAQPYQAQYQPQYPGAPMQISPVIMQYVPTTFNANPPMISPPLTPQREKKKAS